ncbi:hypothetical protein Pmani_037850 [Petrolisthes manimaculis]|nr:hypothetical protein Pmani_037850 [Petrolisthes manimaculis]
MREGHIQEKESPSDLPSFPAWMDGEFRLCLPNSESWVGETCDPRGEVLPAADEVLWKVLASWPMYRESNSHPPS